jgi:MYXO-CTERM domain-containing protein
VSRPRALALGLLCLLAAGVIAAAPAAAAPKGTTVQLSLSRAHVSTGLGDSFGFTSTITNAGSAQLSGLVAHLNVVGFDPGVYVDPEDWSSQRTRYLAPLPPGKSTKIDWTVKAVNGGHLAIYVVVLPSNNPGAVARDLSVSPALDLRVAERRTLNPGGVLPLVIGLPALLGLAALGMRRRRRG